jgi:omega-hydroxy-beta-dihydromenaquinone-9 sulfotransferase
MLRAGILRHGRIVGDRRKALFMLQNLVHRNRASNLPAEANAFWIKYFGTYKHMTEEDYSNEIASYYKKQIMAVQNLWGRPRFVNKNLQHCVRVRLLNKIFPDMKFIHIIRDGRAVAFSTLSRIELARSSSTLLQQMLPYLGVKEILGNKYRLDRSELYNYGLAWAEFVRKAREASACAKSRYYEVHYENLITEPYKELRKILDFCELDWYAEFEDKIPSTQDMNKKWKQKASKGQLVDLEESTIDLRQTLGMAE